MDSNSVLFDHFYLSKQFKDQINEKIAQSIRYFNGEPYGNEVDYRAQLVWKLIKKQGKTLVANLIKPFIGNEHIVSLNPVNAEDFYKKEIDEKIINHFWSKEFNKDIFLKTLTNVLVKEGTAFVKVGWIRDYTEKVVYTKIQTEEDKQKLLALEEKGFEVEPTKDPTRFKISKKTFKYNKPVALVLQNENVFTDPLATSIEDSRFIIIRRLVTKEDLLSDPIYDKEAVKRAFNRMASKKLQEMQKDNERPDQELADEIANYDQYTDLRDDLKTSSYYSEQTALGSSVDDLIDRKLFVYEYWFKEDGKVKVSMFLDMESDVEVIGTEELDEFKEFPFVNFQLFDNEFSLWGDSLADMIGDEQKVMTSIVRGVIDNLAMSNNGQKFIKKGALDPINFQRAVKGEPIVEVNANIPLTQVMMNGNFNELPSSVYNLLQIIERQSEGLTGISQMIQGINGNEAKMPASNFGSLMSQSQIRLEYFLSNIKEGLKRIFIRWLYMAWDYLTEQEIKKITGVSITEAKMRITRKLQMQYQVDQLDPETQQKVMMIIVKEVDEMFDKRDVIYDIDFNIGVDGMKAIKIQNINMFLQQAAPLVQTGAVDPQVIKLLIAQLAKELDYPRIAKMIENYEPQPDPMNEEMAKVQLEQNRAKAIKELALAENAKARAEAVKAKAQKEVATIPHDIEKKDLENQEKLANIEAIQQQTMMNGANDEQQQQSNGGNLSGN